MRQLNKSYSKARWPVDKTLTTTIRSTEKVKQPPQSPSHSLLPRNADKNQISRTIKLRIPK